MRLALELMEKDHYSISVINGTNIRKRLLVKNSQKKNDNDKKGFSNSSVFILDDRGTSIGVAKLILR